jgi:hypothetical protein
MEFAPTRQVSRRNALALLIASVRRCPVARPLCGRQCNECSENDLGFLEAHLSHLVAIASVPAKSCTGVTPGLAPAQQQNELEGLNQANVMEFRRRRKCFAWIVSV